MIKLTFQCSGRELKYGPGIHDQLSNIANSIEENTGLQLEHFNQNGNHYTLWFLTNKLHEFLMTKGAMGMSMIEQPSGIALFKSTVGIHDIKWEEDNLY